MWEGGLFVWLVGWVWLMLIRRGDDVPFRLYLG